MIAISIVYTKITGTEFSSIPLRLHTLFFLVLISILNWHFEVLKWKTLVGTITKTKYHTAFSQSLAAHTAAIITPNKIGEYGAKALFYKKSLRKKVLGLTFLGNAYQLIITVLFGALGIFFHLQVNKVLPFNTLLILSFYALIISGIYYYLYASSKLKKITAFLKKVSTKTQIKIGFYSFLRYLLFSFQYYYFLLLFGVEVSYAVLFPLIWLMYFISSCIPSFSIADFAIKGSVAIFLFSEVGIPESTIVAVAFLMWVLNFALPAIIGGIYIIRFKTQNQLDYDTN